MTVLLWLVNQGAYNIYEAGRTLPKMPLFLVLIMFKSRLRSMQQQNPTFFNQTPFVIIFSITLSQIILY